jgi:hypothetical protein
MILAISAVTLAVLRQSDAGDLGDAEFQALRGAQDLRVPVLFETGPGKPGPVRTTASWHTGTFSRVEVHAPFGDKLVMKRRRLFVRR